VFLLVSCSPYITNKHAFHTLRLMRHLTERSLVFGAWLLEDTHSAWPPRKRDTCHTPDACSRGAAGRTWQRWRPAAARRCRSPPRCCRRCWRKQRRSSSALSCRSDPWPAPGSSPDHADVQTTQEGELHGHRWSGRALPGCPMRAARGRMARTQATLPRRRPRSSGARATCCPPRRAWSCAAVGPQGWAPGKVLRPARSWMPAPRARCWPRSRALARRQMPRTPAASVCR